MSTPEAPSQIQSLVAKNVQALLEVRRRFERQRTLEQRAADAITRFSGSMTFVYLHAALLVTWLVVNLGAVPGVRPFDPYPFVLLAAGASVEAIFLSTFVLISQNRMNELADRRADLDVQINLLSEHEITRLIALVDDIARHLGVEHAERRHLQALKQDVAPEDVLQKLEEAAEKAGGADGGEGG